MDRECCWYFEMPKANDLPIPRFPDFRFQWIYPRRMCIKYPPNFFLTLWKKLILQSFV